MPARAPRTPRATQWLTRPLIPVHRGNFSEIARRADVDRTHVSRILRGLARPGLEPATRIAEALGWTVEELHGYLETQRSRRTRGRG